MEHLGIKVEGHYGDFKYCYHGVAVRPVFHDIATADEQNRVESYGRAGFI